MRPKQKQNRKHDDTEKNTLTLKATWLTGYIYIYSSVIEAIWKMWYFWCLFFVVFLEENGWGDIREKHERVKVSTLGEKKSGGGRC